MYTVYKFQEKTEGTVLLYRDERLQENFAIAQLNPNIKRVSIMEEAIANTIAVLELERPATVEAFDEMLPTVMIDEDDLKRIKDLIVYVNSPPPFKY